METIKINCPHCEHPLEYWTRNNFINCPKCNGTIAVEPCKEIIIEEVEEIESNGDIEIYPEEPAK